MTTLDQRHPDQQSQSSLTEETEDAVYDSLDSFAACFCCNPLENFLPDFISVQGQAFDVIVIQSASTGRVASSDFRITFEHPTTPFPPKESTMEEDHCEALLEVADEKLGKVYFPVDHHSLHKRCRLRGTPKCDSMSRSAACQARSKIETGTEQETLQLLAKMLKTGKNDVRYLFRTENRVLGIALASVYLWYDTDKVVVCDVDGTITKSNIRGIYDTIVAEKYVHCHEKVCAFLTRVKNGGKEHHDDENPQQPSDDRPKVNILYLSSRPLAIASSTRKFLSKVRQPEQEVDSRPRKSWSNRSLNASSTETIAPGKQHRLPDGPLIGFPGKLTEVLKMEMVTHSVHLFKASTLLEQVVTPFCDASGSKETHESMFIAGFGNTMMDVQGYHMAGLKLSQIYLIDKKSRISCLDAGTTQTQDEQQEQPQKRSSSKRNRMEGSNTFVLVDDSLPNYSNDGTPALKMPLKCYRKEFGTVFQGYRDEAIVSHVFSDKSIVAA